MAKSLGIPDLQQCVALVKCANKLPVSSTDEEDGNSQLTGESAKGNVFPRQLAFVGLLELRDVLVDGVVEMEAPQRMLVKQSKSRKSLCDRSDTILAVSVDRGHSWPLFIVLLCTVILGPQSSIARSHLDGER